MYADFELTYSIFVSGLIYIVFAKGPKAGPLKAKCRMVQYWDPLQHYCNLHELIWSRIKIAPVTTQKQSLLCGSETGTYCLVGWMVGLGVHWRLTQTQVKIQNLFRKLPELQYCMWTWPFLHSSLEFAGFCALLGLIVTSLHAHAGCETMYARRTSKPKRDRTNDNYLKLINTLVKRCHKLHSMYGTEIFFLSYRKGKIHGYKSERASSLPLTDEQIVGQTSPVWWVAKWN
jgi:hypothetical protein